MAIRGLTEAKCVMETLLNLPASELYRPIDEVIMQQLEQRYVGYCERQCLVTQISRIIRRSDVRMTQSRLDGSGDVSVSFEVVGNVLNVDDLLAGCRIININNNELICTHPKVTLTVIDRFMARILQVGNAITVRVTGASYERGTKTITATGVFFYIVPEPKCYLTSVPSEAPTTPELLQMLRQTLARAVKARSEYNDAPTARRDFFRAMYYSYKAPLPDTIIPKGIKRLNLVDLANQVLGRESEVKPFVDSSNQKQMMLVTHVLLDVSLGDVFQVDTPLIQSNPVIKGPAIFEFDMVKPIFVYENLVQLLCRLLEAETRYLRMLTDMAIYYQDDEVFRGNQRIWDKLIAQHLDFPKAERAVTKETKPVSKEAKEVKNSKEAKEVKNSKEAKEVKNSKEAKEIKNTKEAKEVKNSKEAKEVKNSKEAKEVKNTKEVKSAPKAAKK